MKVPTLTTYRTQAPTTTQATSRAQANPAAFGAGLGQAISQFGAVLEQRRKQSQDLDIRRQAAQEATQLQLDFHERQKQAPLGAEGFTQATLGDYTERHQQILEDLRSRGFSEEAVADMDLRLAGMRDNLVGQSLRFQDQSWQTKIASDLEETGMHLTQLASMNPYDLDAAIEELNEAVDGLDNLTAIQRQEFKDRNAKAIRIAAGLGLAAQQPDAVVSALTGGQGGSYRDAVRRHESGGAGGAARNPRSSAKGYYQFLDGTWADLVRNNPGSGLRMDGRGDRAQEELAMDLFEAQNSQVLARHGLPPTRANMYAMHFFGEGDGPKVLRAADDTALSDIVSPEVMAANPHLAGKSVGWAKAWTRRVVGAGTGMPKDGKTGDPVLDSLDAQERLQVLNHARTQLNQAQAQQRAELDVMTNNASAAYLSTGEYTGPEPTYDMFIQSYGPVRGEQEYSEFQRTREVGAFISGMRTASAADIAEQLAALRPTDTGTPTYATDLAVFDRAQAAANRVQQMRQDDPANYIMTNFPSVQEAWNSGDMSAGYAAMNEAYDQLGILPMDRVPMSEGHLARVNDALRSMTPEQKLRELTQWRQTMGPLFQNGLEQIAKGGLPVEAYLSGLVTDSPAHAAVAANVLRGMEILEHDPSRRPSQTEVNRTFRETMGVAQQALNPLAADAMNKAATALYVFRGGSPEATEFNVGLYEQSLREVVGGSAEDTDTGIVDVGGPSRLFNVLSGSILTPYKTILPSGVTGTQFRDWIDGLSMNDIESLGNGSPTYEYGNVATAEDIVREGEFVRVSTDEYIVLMDSDGLPLRAGATDEYFRMRLTRDVILGGESVDAIP